MKPAAIIHGVIVGVGLICYTVLTALGHDGTALLTASLAWGGAAVADRAIEAGG